MASGVEVDQFEACLQLPVAKKAKRGTASEPTDWLCVDLGSRSPSSGPYFEGGLRTIDETNKTMHRSTARAGVFIAPAHASEE